MKAAVFHGRGDIRIETLPDPTPARGEILLEVLVCGACGTDAAEYRDGPHFPPLTTRHPVTGHVGPTVLGHEFVGRIIDSNGAEGFHIGDIVATGAGIACGTCDPCRIGRTNLCRRYSTLGLDRHGGFAELCVAPASTCVPIEAFGISSDVAGLAQPMAIAVHAFSRGRVRPGESVLIVGIGGIGAFLTWVAVRAGARVAAIDVDEQRLAIADSLGAAETISGRGDDPSSRSSGNGRPVDVIFEVTGRADALGSVLAIAEAASSRVVLVGLHDRPREVDLRSITLREVELIGTNAHILGSDLPKALGLLAERREGWSDVAPRVLPLERLVSDVLRPMSQGMPLPVKSLVDPRTRAERSLLH